MTASAVVFDLDGTLWDTTATCAEGWNAVLARLGVDRVVTAEDVRRVTGRSHDEAIDLVFPGLDARTRARLSEETQREDNALLARRGGDLYPGVHELIPWLAASTQLLIVSNCQAGYIEIFRTTSGLDASFGDHECWGRTGKAKPENLRLLLERNGIASAIMVGDTGGDHAAAKANSLPFVHAAYGFGQVEAPDAAIGSFDELPAVLDRLAR